MGIAFALPAAATPALETGGGWASLPPADPAKLGAELEDKLVVLRSFGPRTEGSGGERKTVDWIAASLRKAGLEVGVESLDDLTDDQSDSQAVTVSIRGRRDDSLVFIVPLDSFRDAAPGEGDAAIALSLVELERLAPLLGKGRNPGIVPPIGLEFVFLPGDRRGSVSDGSSQGPGTAWWFDHVDMTNPLAVVYLAFDAVPGRIELLNAAKGNLSPWWLFDRSQSALRASALPFDIDPNRMQGYRLRLLSLPGPLDPYLDNGIPAVELKGKEPIRPGRSPAWGFSRFVEALVDRNAEGFPDTWDRNYSSFRLGGLSLEIRETPFMVFLLCFAASVTILVLGLSLSRRSHIPRFLEKLPHRALNLGLLGLIAAIAILVAGAGRGVESLIIGSDSAWRTAPALFAAVRLAVAFLLFFGLLSEAVALRLISPDPWFYEISALVLFGVDILLFAFLSLPLSLYFCWGLFVVFVSIAVRRRWASLVATLLMALPLSLVIGEMLAAPGNEALALITEPDPLRGLLLALVMLPFATMAASPLLFFAPRGLVRRRAAAVIFVGLALLVEAGAVGYASSRAAGRPIKLAETIDQDHGSWKAVLKSDARLSGLDLTRDGIALSLRSATGTASLEGSDARRLVGMDSRSTKFLDRETIATTLSFPREADGLSLRLVSKSPLTIYDCNLPYRVDLDGKSATIFVGPGKGRRLELSLTVSADFAATLEVRADFAGGLSTWSLRQSRPLTVSDAQLRASFQLGGIGR